MLHPAATQSSQGTFQVSQQELSCVTKAQNSQNKTSQEAQHSPLQSVSQERTSAGGARRPLPQGALTLPAAASFPSTARGQALTTGPRAQQWLCGLFPTPHSTQITSPSPKAVQGALSLRSCGKLKAIYRSISKSHAKETSHSCCAVTTATFPHLGQNHRRFTPKPFSFQNKIPFPVLTNIVGQYTMLNSCPVTSKGPHAFGVIKTHFPSLWLEHHQNTICLFLSPISPQIPLMTPAFSGRYQKSLYLNLMHSSRKPE